MLVSRTPNHRINGTQAVATAGISTAAEEGVPQGILAAFLQVSWNVLKIKATKSLSFLGLCKHLNVLNSQEAGAVHSVVFSSWIHTW